MFCPKCNIEVADEANFCPDCGSRLKPGPTTEPQNQSADSATSSVKIQASDEDKEASNLKKAVKHSLKLSHRTARTILLIALVLALGSSIAYAAFYVYQNVYLPSQQEQTEQESSDSENDSQEYKIESKSIEVNALDPSSFIDSDHKMKRGASQWNYDLLQGAENDAALKKINSLVEKAIQESAKNAEDEDADPVGCTLDRCIKITALTDRYVCYVDSIAQSNGAGRVWHITFGVFFDLKTGNSISPSEALGTPSKELAKKCRKAARAYMKKNPLGDSPMDEESGQDALESLQTGTQTDELGITSKYLQTEKGTIYIAEALRYSYEFAWIVIDPSSNKLKAGDDVDKFDQICLVPRTE